MRTLCRAGSFLALIIGLFLVACAPALAIVTSWSERQVVPGLTERSIWSQDQVAVYRLPSNVTHVGTIHVELTFKPADRDCYLYLLDATGQVCAGTELQGRQALVPGKEVVDFGVTAVQHPEPTPEGDGMVGDVYYVMVQAATSASSFQLRGYWPRAEPGSMDPSSPFTFTRALLQLPARASAWSKVSGAPYSGPWDLVPTSQGTVYCRLQYPADAAKRVVGATTAATGMPASFEQYVFPDDWDPDSGVPIVSQPTDPSHWDLWNLNRHASAAPVAGGEWFGLEGSFLVDRAGANRPGRLYHYLPVLWMRSAQPVAGPAAPLTGIRTQGYKATLLVPQNLRLARATATVRRGRMATFKGTLALPSGAAATDPVAWAPAGTRLQLQKKLAGKWVRAKSVTVAASGAWKTTVKPRATTLWRAFWPGSGGLGAESSLSRKVTVRR